MPIAKVREALQVEIFRHKELVNKSEMWSGIENPTSEKLRSRITRAEAVLAGGDKMEMIKITRILKKVR